MARFTVRGEVLGFGQSQYNIRVGNEAELRRFWLEQNIDTRIDWSGDGPVLITVGARNLVARCNPGDIVEYEFETWDRNDGRRIRGIDLRVIERVSEQ